MKLTNTNNGGSDTNNSGNTNNGGSDTKNGGSDSKDNGSTNNDGKGTDNKGTDGTGTGVNAGTDNKGTDTKTGSDNGDAINDLKGGNDDTQIGADSGSVFSDDQGVKKVAAPDVNNGNDGLPEDKLATAVADGGKDANKTSDKKSDKDLPTTDESKQNYLAVLGATILMGLGALGIRKNKKRQDGTK